MADGCASLGSRFAAEQYGMTIRVYPSDMTRTQVWDTFSRLPAAEGARVDTVLTTPHQRTRSVLQARALLSRLASVVWVTCQPQNTITEVLVLFIARTDKVDPFPGH